MRAVLVGTVAAFRYEQLKDGRVGQIDLIQAGDKRYPTKVTQLYIASSAYCRLILEHLEKYRDPFVTLLVWLDFGRELKIEVTEILEIRAEELHPNGGTITNGDADPDEPTDNID